MPGTTRSTWRAALLGAVAALGLAHAGATICLASEAVAAASPGAPAYPIKASGNNRYLVDRNERPFLMVGDAPQTLIAKVSVEDAATYMANRRRYGVNTLWINLLCNDAQGCHKDAATFDGVAPFAVEGDLSTPNPAFFRRAETMLDIAAANGMVVLLDPIETIGWLGVLRANGSAKAFAYGAYLGDRFKDVPNIVWMHGNDFQSWRNATDDALVQAVAKGIRSSDPNHIHTIELNYQTSGSLDDKSWAPLIELDAAYTYLPTFAQVLAEYNRADFKPVFLVEANYEFESLPYTDGGSPQNLRRQEYWAMLSGATGQVYGSAYTWQFNSSWQAKLDSPGVVQLAHMKKLFAARRWYDLVPDQTHTVVTSGYGGFSGRIAEFAISAETTSRWSQRLFGYIRRHVDIASIASNTYASVARTPDGALAIVYMPSIRTITVDMSKLAGPVTARWYDPAGGQYVDASDAPLTNTGERQFRPPGNNSAGDGDWVLVLEASTAR